MSVSSMLEEPGRVDEPQAAQDYAAMLTRVVDAGQPLIVRRDGRDLAAVIPLEHLDLLRELHGERQAHQEAEAVAVGMIWTGSEGLRPPQSWFDDEADNPFEPEEGRSPPPEADAGPATARPPASGPPAE